MCEFGHQKLSDFHLAHSDHKVLETKMKPQMQKERRHTEVPNMIQPHSATALIIPCPQEIANSYGNQRNLPPSISIK